MSGEQRGRRTWIQLYNARRAWFVTADRNLDAAVLSAFGWEPGMPDDDLLGAIVGVELGAFRDGGDMMDRVCGRRSTRRRGAACIGR